MKLVENHGQIIFHRKNFLQVLAIHLVALGVAPFLFDWNAFLFAVGTMFLFGYSMGIFHHMLFTHRSFKCAKWIENLGGLFGTLTWRGPFAGPVQYVAMHKIHHAHSDTPLDPHSPTNGIWHALLTWFWNIHHGFSRHELYDTYAPEMMNLKWLVFLDRNVHLLQLAWGTLCFLGGALVPAIATGTPDWENGVRFAVYGVFVRAFMSLYLINAVDVINHTVGYRSYETKDHSTNSFLMFAVHLGGAISWHNNHHAHMHYFTVRRHWWEVDVHYLFLKGLEKVGLASDILIWDEVKTHSNPNVNVGLQPKL